MALNLKIGDIVQNKYRIEKLINRGGMNSYLFLASNLHVQEFGPLQKRQFTRLVLKVVQRTDKINDNNWKKFLDETITTTRVSHKNLVQTFDVVSPRLSVLSENQVIVLEDTVMIVMEYVDGPSLREMLNQKGYFSVQEVVYYFTKLVKVINYLHSFEHQIIHRDLKPENILFTSNLTDIKLLDFGIASAVIRNAEKTEVLTDENSLFGTVSYMTPEVLESTVNKEGKRIRKPPTVQYDIYSLGVILFEMLVGRVPFNKSIDPKKERETIQKARNFDVPLMGNLRSDVPVSLENIVFKCTAVKRENSKWMYSDTKQLLADLAQWQTEQILIKPVHERILEGQNEMRELMVSNYLPWYLRKGVLIFFSVVLLALLIAVVSFFIITGVVVHS
ncbi:serine/threonine-protein kinase [Mycoplasmoides pneumoniae]|uniref:serine/threonine-protein kinase n=1 Tax=Mycoplasmoides pneumoniae TaxID=2104 RepID=UPI0013758011|nr:serine/threonine-protein kinase [Mycoplasmoides pneumoniae]QHR07319.1 serine/threonine protein kinase [Mycoplasmoides pneumoniae]